MGQKMKCNSTMLYYFLLLSAISIYPAPITGINIQIVNPLPDDKRSPNFPHQWVKTSINRAKISGNPECRFSFEITIPESDDPKALHHDTVCLYWRPGGFGALELENRVYIYENGFSKIHTSMIPLRSLGILTVNGNLLLSNNSYVFGYILGSDFFGMVQTKKVYFIETRNKISKILNMSERSTSPSTGHSAIIFPEEATPIYNSHRDRHRKKRDANDYDDDDDDSDADNSSDGSKENQKIETSSKSNNSLPTENVLQAKMTFSATKTQLPSANDQKQDILKDSPDFYRSNENILRQAPQSAVTSANDQEQDIPRNSPDFLRSNENILRQAPQSAGSSANDQEQDIPRNSPDFLRSNENILRQAPQSDVSSANDQEQDIPRDSPDFLRSNENIIRKELQSAVSSGNDQEKDILRDSPDSFRSNENILRQTPQPAVSRVTQSLNIALIDMPILPSDTEPKTIFSVRESQLSPTNDQEQDVWKDSSDSDDSNENISNEVSDPIVSTVTQSLSFLSNEADLTNIAFEQQDNVFQFENKRLLICKVALIVDESFFWSLGRGNEASTVGRVMYYLDFADSFLRAVNLSGNMQRESIGLELETIHLDISTTNVTALYANTDQTKKIQSGNKMVPSFEKEQDNCLTILFTATPITNLNSDSQWKPVGMCPNHERTSTLAIQETFPIIVNAIGKDGKEIPDARIIHDLIEKILYSFGGNPASPPCENKQTSPLKFFMGSYLKSLSLKNCIRDQICSTLKRKIDLTCLHQKSGIGVCKPIAWDDKENCDCGYRSYCLSDENLCCLKLHGNIFRKCSVDNVPSKCYNASRGSCHNMYDSVCLSATASNYVKGSFGEFYAMANYNEDDRDSSSSMKFDVRYFSSSILIIFWHSLFYFLLHD